MKTMTNFLKSLLLIAAMMTGITNCRKIVPHEMERGVAIVLDNSQCSDAAIGKTNLYIYDTESKLCASYDYADARAVALDLLPLEAGHYTFVAVINADGAPSETSSLTALHE